MPENVTHWAFKHRETRSPHSNSVFLIGSFLILSKFLSLFCAAPPPHPFNTDVANWLAERKGNRPTSLSSSSSSPHPRPLAHERGRPGPMDDRRGVCYARAPDPDTTQHTAPQATTAGLECDLLQTWPRVRETQVEGGGHGWRDVGNRGAHAVPQNESSGKT